MRILNYLGRAVFFAAASIVFISQLQAATHRVHIRHIGTRFIFDPTNITVNVGDIVLWTNAAPIAHDTTSRANPPLWASGLIQPNGQFSRQFNTLGNFGYFCQTHAITAPNQTGLVQVVQAPNLPPVVSLTNPPNNLLVTGPTNILLQASASDPDGSVARVRFLRDGAQLFEDLTSPYSFTVSNLAAGKYTFTAQAFDNAGAFSSSSNVNVTVVSPIVLSNPRLDGTKTFQFDYNADTGGTYVIRRSATNGSPNSQIPVKTNIATSSLQTHTETNIAGNQTFTVIRTQ